MSSYGSTWPLPTRRPAPHWGARVGQSASIPVVLAPMAGPTEWTGWSEPQILISGPVRKDRSRVREKSVPPRSLPPRANRCRLGLATGFVAAAQMPYATGLIQRAEQSANARAMRRVRRRLGALRSTSPRGPVACGGGSDAAHWNTRSYRVQRFVAAARPSAANAACGPFRLDAGKL